MGRLAYTPATTRHLVAVAHDNDEALHNVAMNLAAAEEAKNQAPVAEAGPAVHREKDPHSWSQRAFNPDDESLPMVLEQVVSSSDVVYDEEVVEEDYEIVPANDSVWAAAVAGMGTSRATFREEAQDEDDDNGDLDHNAHDDAEDDDVSYYEGDDSTVVRPPPIDAISPSAPVFHAHTLPLTLPNSPALAWHSR